MGDETRVQVLNALENNEFRRWSELTEDADVYYSPHYARVAAEMDAGVPILMSVSNAHGRILHPFILRRLDMLSGDMSGWADRADLISPYGYGGPVYLGEPGGFSGLSKALEEALIEYCSDNRVVSEFIRFHPLTDNHALVDDYYRVVTVNDTVLMELGKSREDVVSSLPAKTRNMVRRAREAGITIVHSSNPAEDDIDAFYALYTETMLHRQATRFYMFSRELLAKTVRTLGGRAELFLAVDDSSAEPITGAIILVGADAIHYHLSGSRHNKMIPGANNLLLLEAAVWGAETGKRFFHLGGGLGSNDSLFKFKASFSPLRAAFKVGKRIHDASAYAELTKAVKGSEYLIMGVDAHFFPEYRSRG